MDPDLCSPLQAASSAQAGAPVPHLTVSFTMEHEPPSDEEPLLEVCKRELDAVLASLDGRDQADAATTSSVGISPRCCRRTSEAS